jgi:uncharacterized Zn finger protein
VPRETARQKADRLLLEGRVSIVHVDANHVRAHVRGEGHIYRAGFTQGQWACNCPARSDGCSHLHALRRVVAVDIEQRQPQQPRLHVVKENQS